jgi:nitrogen regulatory protein PII
VNVPPTQSKLVTIITAFEARDLVLQAFADLGVRKYSVVNVEGMGTHGERRSGITMTRNLMYMVVASEGLAARVLQWVERVLIMQVSSIAFSTDAVAVAALPIR